MRRTTDMRRTTLAAALAFSFVAMPVSATEHPYERRDASGLFEAVGMLYQHRVLEGNSAGLCITFRLFDIDIAEICIEERDPRR